MKRKYNTIDELNNARPQGSRLRAVEFIYKPDKHGVKTLYARCVCEACGKVDKDVLIGQITSNYISCGCVNLDRWRKMVTKNYPVVPKIQARYKSMIARCYSPRNVNYKKYGLKGVRVCEEWVGSYQKFLDWSLANGYQDGLTLDKDIKGDGFLYSPETCSWVTNEENQRHKSNTVRYSYDGEMLTLSEIEEITGISGKRIYQRMQHGETTLEQAIYLINNKINRRYAK